MQAETAAYGVKTFISRNGSQDLNSLEITRLLERYNLSWLYITDGSSKPSAETSRFAPNMVDYPMRSGTINLRGTEYYEAVMALPTGFMIHVGMDCTYPGLPLSALEDLLFFWNMPFRGGTVIAIFILAGAINFIVLSRIFLTPLSKFRQDIDNLAATAAPSLVAFDKIALSPLASSELWSLKKSVHSLFESLGQHERGKERANAAPTAPGKEGPWQNPSENELQAVSDGRLPGVGERKARNTVHALKALKQSEENLRRKYYRRSAGRFPGIVSGVVFMKGDVLDGKSTSDSIVKSAGLNTGQLVELQSLNLLPIFEQARTSGKAVNLGPMSLKRTGLDAIMHKLNAQHIVLAPIRHRRRYLGFMLVLTNVALGPDQIRALERLLDQTASVYNSLLLREAKEEKIWTDPLTKLRNRSYLQEVVTDLTTTINVTSGQTYAIAYFSVNSETGSTDDNLDNYALCVAKALSHLKETQHLSKLGDLSKLEFIRAQPLEFALIIRGEKRNLLRRMLP
ncbi:MAG: hypothetical protein HC888_07745 [Candidatus Competibacteraceae bacterium]|nr:hypothetical protein [Candidatus Competibacteraceae bacterium]